MAEPVFDAIVIGGGPGGSTAASFLAQADRSVLLLEKEHFPRFHVGESLLPYNQRIFKELGVAAELAESGFTRKFGAQFHLGNGSKHVKFVFRNGALTREHQAIQVERGPFDHCLLKNASRCGAEVREGWTVKRFDRQTDQVIVTARDPDGGEQTLTGRFLVDASGRGNLTGNQEGIRVDHPRLKKLALWGHFHHVQLDDGDHRGDTVIVRLENKWFWIIPVARDKTSVGCVMDKAEFNQAGLPPEKLFWQICETSSVLRERMRRAEAVSPLQTTTDFSYRNKRLVGHRLLRVGDAAGFMDPIFSAGVFLAMLSGKLASRAVLDALKRNHDGARRLAKYEKAVQRSMRYYWEMVEHYYTTPFMEIFLEPRDKWNLPAAVNAILAGELDGGWAMRWRLRLFFWLVKLQSRFPLVPRISFDPLPSEAQD